MGKSKPKKCYRPECDKDISSLGGFYIGPKRCHCSRGCANKTIRELEEQLREKRARMLQPVLFK